MLELQARNPFPSTPVAAEKYADRMGGEAWKRIKEDLEALGRRVEQTGEFGAAVIVGPPGSGKTHVCMNFLKGSPSLFPIYVDASRGRDLKEEALESAEASARRLGYAGLSDYLSAFAYGYARKRAGDKKFEAELEYGLRDRLFHSSYDGYLRALRDGKIYLTRRASFLLRLIAGQVRPSDFEELLALIETLSKEMGMRVALVVDETGEEYERELKSLYNRQPPGLLLITTFVPDRWAAIKDKALKDRFYSASVFRQLGYPKQEDLVDIVMSYARDVPGLNRELVAAAIQKGGMSDIRDTLRKFHDAFESCRGNPPCMLEALTSVTGDNGELSRAVERYMRWQVLPELKERGLISYFSDKGKKIQSLSSVLDLVFATENTLFLGDVKVSDQDIYLDEDINVMKASKVEGIELNGKVYKDIRPFLVTNAKVGNDIPVVYITPDEITSILAGFSPPSVGEKMERLVRSRTIGPGGLRLISYPEKTASGLCVAESLSATGKPPHEACSLHAGGGNLGPLLWKPGGIAGKGRVRLKTAELHVHGACVPNFRLLLRAWISRRLHCLRWHGRDGAGGPVGFLLYHGLLSPSVPSLLASELLARRLRRIRRCDADERVAEPHELSLPLFQRY
ncbi:MAG: hypothetical protein ACP5UI_04115 [Thermoprotei archaeon]|nr:hypothetical protein [TACK group archaeon]